MKNGFNILICLLLLSAGNCLAQAISDEDPIDREYNSCILKDSSSANICACAYFAYGKWEGEMDNAYKKLNRILKKDSDKAALKQSQTAWKAYRDAEFSSYDHMFNRPGGNWCGIRQDNRIEVVRARAIQLRGYLEALKQK